ncbi:MAG: urease accessory protein UreD [Burkholderiaceae bacterium]|jgi:urease accessory protein|nr:urease accessory protein UreD [Burkholderiaceae bacterium]
MNWRADLIIDYAADAAGRTVARHRHSGPLRILQSLYPEGDAVCHNVLVHPPGGIVGGDVLDIRVRAQAGAHGLLTTPGATRFYRSPGAPGIQQTHLQVDAGARLEWLPLESICYNACRAENRTTLSVAPGGELMGWELTALGLPHAGEPFAQGQLLQHLEMPGIWLERGLIRASDHRLMNSPLGLAGQRCMGTLFFVAGQAIAHNRAEAALQAARALVASSGSLSQTSGVTQVHAQVLALRTLAPMVEPAMDLLRQIRASWRQLLWQRAAHNPRIWAM